MEKLMQSTSSNFLPLNFGNQFKIYSWNKLKVPDVNNIIFFILFNFIINPEYMQAQWTQQGADIDGEANSDYSGNSVSISSDGTIVAIGALDNAGGGSDRGHVRVYKKISGIWTQQGSDIDGEANEDESGTSVSLSSDGTIVAIGAPNNWGAPRAFNGHVRVYKNISGTWTQQGSDINGESDFDYSGTSVSLSSDGTIVAIGAPNNAGGGSFRGHVRVYKKISGIWTQQGGDIDGEANDDYSGNSVSLSSDGNIVAIGAPGNSGGGTTRGQVRVYKNISGTWTQQGSDIDGEANDDNSGNSVSLSSDGNIVAIGAFNNSGGGTTRGHVRVYKNISGTWTQQGSDIDGEANGDYSGSSVSLSSNGTIVAIGAYNNAGGGTNRGHVRVYKNISGTWTQQGSDIDGEANDDYSGTSVSLSSDGTILAIGAPSNDAGGLDRGHVRVYNYCLNIYNASDMIYYCTLEEALAAASIGDEIQIPAGTYSSPCFTVGESITLTPIGAVTIGCIVMNGSGKLMKLGGDITINLLTLTEGKISTNGHKLSAGAISGGDPSSYIITD